MITTDKYCLFYNGPFSNWFYSDFYMYGRRFYTSEHAFMWSKALTFGDTKAADMILDTVSPEIAKSIGRQVVYYDDVYWSSIRYQVMLNVLRYKFSNPIMRDVLMKYRHLEIVEASPYDLVWGIGFAENDPRALDKDQWEGQNLLGKALNELGNMI